MSVVFSRNHTCWAWDHVTLFPHLLIAMDFVGVETNCCCHFEQNSKWKTFSEQAKITCSDKDLLQLVWGFFVTTTECHHSITISDMTMSFNSIVITSLSWCLWQLVGSSRPCTTAHSLTARWTNVGLLHRLEWLDLPVCPVRLCRLFVCHVNC